MMPSPSRRNWLPTVLGLLAMAWAGCGSTERTYPDAGTDGDGGQLECRTSAECDDGNACTDDMCQGGTCVHEHNTSPCDDGQTCTDNDRCQGGVCVGESSMDCDDDNPCTTDTCDDAQGCVHLNNTFPCDDGNPCTVSDTCADGACSGAAKDCSTMADECNTGACNPVTGACQQQPVNNGTPCDDGQECSSNDACSNGVCVGESDLDCDDENICTEDHCDDALGCVYSFNHAPCDDGNACTTDDMCNDGACGGTPLGCNDGNPCTTDSCDVASGCRNVPNSDPCDDDNECTVLDTCSGGVCQSGGPRNCDDGNECTTDSCDPGLGCVNAENNLPCDDGNPCTEGDVCQDGACQPGGSTFDCDDDNPCTDDSCDPAGGCEHNNNTAACNDANSCTMNDVCANGACSGVPLDADGDSHIAEGCPNGDDCDDSNASINPDAFEGGTPGTGVCGDGLDNDCDGLTDSDPTCAGCTGNSDCDDNNVCNGAETCVANQCQPGTDLDCADTNPCTDDLCNPSSGCYHQNNTAPCNDNNVCTLGDTCGGGSCQPGSGSLDCSDGNPCTDDVCDSVAGCSNPFNNDPCSDGNQCTTGDQCSGGSCQPGTGTLDCNDSNPCTDDGCNPGSGCVNTPDDTNTCNDGDPCTENDHCSAGSCVGSGLVCDDGNPCTDDSCAAGTGCTYTNDDTNACSDGSDCTQNDRCFDGLCVGDIRDRDGDTYRDELCGGDDCDDLDASVNPGASESCGDGVDNDCDDLTDEDCATCTTIDPAAELIIDNDSPMYIMPLDVDEEALNLFFVESTSYNVIAIQAAFYDASGGSGSGQGQYQAVIFSQDAETGMPAQELGSSPVQTVNLTWPDDWHTFTLSSPVAFTQGQAFWVAIRSKQDQTTNNFTPLLDNGTLDPYAYGVGYFAPQSQPLDYYLVGGNFLARVQGCGEGPWLTLTAHTHTPAIVPAGNSATITTTLRNRGFAASAIVDGLLSSDAADVSVTAGAASYGTIAQGATANNTPAYGVDTASAAFGIYAMALQSTDGPNTWHDGFGLYVQGSGCTADNHTLQVDNDTPTYVWPHGSGDEVGNYYVIDSTSFVMTSVEVQFYRTDGPNSSNFRAKVYSYRAGKPDQLLWQSNWTSVSGTNIIPITYNLPTPLTFREGNTIFVTIESQSNLEADSFYVLGDDGSGTTGSWANGVVWDDSESIWLAYGISFLVRPHGCQATELRYDSHSTSPSSVNPGTTANVTVTLANDGAINATGVSATLSSPDPDVTVTTGSANYGTVPAGGTATSQTPYVVQVSSGADEFQYLLDLQITDGTNTWDDVLPLRLAGGQVDLAFSEFSTSLAGNDIHYHFVVTNNGNVDCITPFDVDLYIDEEDPPGTGQSGDWNQTFPGLGIGETETIDLVLQDAPAGTYEAYVQVDTQAAVAESNETNNVQGPSAQTVGTTDVFELLSPARKWFPADMPVTYRFVSGNSQPGMTQTEARTAVNNGFQHWEDVATAFITFTTEADTSSSNAGFQYDYHNTMTFNDITGELGSGALAANVPIYTSGQTMVTNGVTFYRMVDADIIFNNNINFGTNAEAAACATSVYDMEGVATHEQGHLLGLDHSPVGDATMYYAIGPCDPNSATLEESDINGVTFIYP